MVLRIKSAARYILQFLVAAVLIFAYVTAFVAALAVVALYPAHVLLSLGVLALLILIEALRREMFRE